MLYGMAGEPKAGTRRLLQKVCRRLRASLPEILWISPTKKMKIDLDRYNLDDPKNVEIVLGMIDERLAAIR